jgi:tartrate dehydratase beta subunit/fumarate hydratase class I family protein
MTTRDATTLVLSGLRDGDIVEINGKLFTMSDVTQSTAIILPWRWYHRLWAWIKRLFA